MKLNEIKEGDYLYYSERAYGSDYADSLIHARKIDGVLMAHPICTNWQGKYINETKENWGEDLPVSAFFDEKCWQKTSYTPECGDPAAWMAENYPLGGAQTTPQEQGFTTEEAGQIKALARESDYRDVERMLGEEDEV